MSQTKSLFDTIDLNLLRLFDAVLREGNLQRAASRLRISQPTASHALARLRVALNDDLFVRSSTGMVPTTRALEMSALVRDALSALELSLTPPSFDPAFTEHTFRIAADNAAVVSLTGGIVEAAAKIAPQITLHIRPSGTIDPDEMMDASELDLYIGRQFEPRERLASQSIMRDDFVVVHRMSETIAPQNNLSLKIKKERVIPLALLSSLPHLHLSSVGDNADFIDQQLNTAGLTRTIKHSLPLLGCRAVLEQNDVIAVMRRSIASWLCRHSILVASELPFASPVRTSHMRWHKRMDAHPPHRWLRKIIREVAQRENAVA